MKDKYRLTVIDYEDRFLDESVQSLLEDDCFILDEVYQKLGKYEDTGLQPSEVVELQKENRKINEKLEKMSFDVVTTDIYNEMRNDLWEDIDSLKQQLSEKEELPTSILSKPEYGQNIYRIIPNSNSNDFNNEPEYKIVQDIFIGMDLNKYVLKNKQFKTLFSQPINKCFLTKAEAEKKLEGLR